MAFSAPVSNPRIDIVYMTPSGDYKIAQGTEAASPTLPTLAPSGDSRTPICAVWNRPGQARIVNFENKDSNTGDGYIYQDLRPWLRTAGAGSAALNAITIPIAPTGDGQAAVGTVITAARADHVHGGVHAVRKVGQTNLQGDIELAGNPSGVLTQAGNRITINSPFSASYTSPQQTITAAGALTLAHGLGAKPTLLMCSIICLVASNNYSLSDELLIDIGSDGGTNQGLSIVVDATNINIRFGSSATTILALDKTTGAGVNLTNSSWNLIVRAWV